MKYFTYIGLALITSSCLVNQKATKVKYTHLVSTTTYQKKITYSLLVPKNFLKKTIKAGGEAGLEDQYWYLDSSVIYISDMEYTLNSENITKKEDREKKFNFSMQSDKERGDTLILEGKDKRELYWKEISIGKVSFGYSNINREKKDLYDKSLNSIKVVN